MKTIITALLAGLLCASALADDAAIVKQWQAMAVKRYPALAVDGSRLNVLFIRLVKMKQLSNPRFFNNPDWPMRLADEAAQLKEREDSSAAAEQAAKSLEADGYTFTVAGRLGAATKEVLDRALDMAESHDMDALQKLTNAGLVVSFSGGQAVKIVDSTIFPPRLKIRAKGELTEVWTTYDAVKNPGAQ